jgi:hypothetical protein
MSIVNIAKRLSDYGSYRLTVRGIAWNYTCNMFVRIYSGPLSYSSSSLALDL